MRTNFLRRSVTAATLSTLLLAASIAPALAQDAPKLNLDNIPDSAVGAVYAFPQQLKAQPEFELFPWEVISAVGSRDLGFDPAKIQQAVAFVVPPIAGNPPSWGVVLQFDEPVGLAEELTGQAEKREAEGVAYLAARRPDEPSFCVYEKNTILIAPEATLTSMITGKAGDSPLRKLLAASTSDSAITAVVAVEPVRDLANQLLVGAPPLPAPLQGLLTLPDLVDSATLGVDIAVPYSTTLKLTARNENSAQEVEAILNDALAFTKQMIVGQATMATVRDPDDPVQQATVRYMQRVADAVEGKIKPSRDGSDVTINLEYNPSYATTGVLAALLLPAVQQAREAARRTQARNTLKQIGLAMHNFHDVYNQFPAQANYKDKKPLLSWRVHVLPFLGEPDLYEQFHLDEPWDSEHNKKLIEKMPAVFQNPNLNAEGFKTNFLLITGEDAAFFGDEGKRIRDFTDGTSNTILAVEADGDQAVVWTKPDDWKFDPEKPLNGLGKLRQGGFNVLFADGSVRFLSNNIDVDLFKALLTPAGGEVVRNP